MASFNDTAPSDPMAGPVSPVDRGELIAGKYRVERAVGFGAMGAVVAAHHLELDQPIAIKILLPEYASKPESVRRFLTEARAAAKLKSVHVARIADVGTAETRAGQVLPYIVMELLEGADLDTVLRERGRLPAAEAIDYVLQACDAVAEAHSLGIVHRDLKPANLFVAKNRDGTPVVKLLDFGISKTVTPSNNRSSSDNGLLYGSPGYMSPEQVRATKTIDHRTDIWSLGVILHELMTGHDTFSGESTADIFSRILHGPPEPIATLAPDVPPQVVEIVMRCLQKDRERRFQSVEELTDALSSTLGELSVPSAVMRRLVPRPSDSGLAVSATAEPSPRRRIVFGTALALAVAGLLGLVAVVAIHARQQKTEARASEGPTAPTPAETAETAPAPLETAPTAETNPPAANASANANANANAAHAPPLPARPLPGSAKKPRAPSSSASAAPYTRTPW